MAASGASARHPPRPSPAKPGEGAPATPFARTTTFANLVTFAPFPRAQRGEGPGRKLRGLAALDPVARVTAVGLARATGARLLDAVLPARCLVCGDEIAAPGALCARCWPTLAFLGPPHCRCCGLPFDHAAVGEVEAPLCGSCLRQPPPFERARAALAYDDASRPLLLQFKHGDATHAAAAFGAWLARAAADLLPDAELIAPVPLHRWRLAPAALQPGGAARPALGRASGRPVAPDLLERRRPTPSQGGLTRLGRARNVEGAFRVRPHRAALAAGRRILLVDDVLTTGATVGACARALRRAGAAAVDVVTLARVARPLS